MRQQTIENHQHTKPAYNTTHLQAWVLGWLISRWSLYNMVLWFVPPVLESVAILPVNKDLVDPEDTFDVAMFRQGGLHEDRPLNHYLRLRKRGSNESFFVNAGYLQNQFMLGPRYGYQCLKEMIKLAQEEITQLNTPQDGPSGVQTPGSNIAG